MPHNLPISAITSRVMIRFINDDLRLSMHPFRVFVSLYRILSLSLVPRIVVVSSRKHAGIRSIFKDIKYFSKRF